MQRIKIAGYVKLAKLWERSADSAIPYHHEYYEKKYPSNSEYELVGVYIDITGKKEIYNRPEMLRLIRDCRDGKVEMIAAQTRGYLAANTKEFCYFTYYLFALGKRIDIVTEDDSYNINTSVNIDQQREAIFKMAKDYIALNPDDYVKWQDNVNRAITEL